jgi:hypothetical protein
MPVTPRLGQRIAALSDATSTPRLADVSRPNLACASLECM